MAVGVWACRPVWSGSLSVSARSGGNGDRAALLLLLLLLLRERGRSMKPTAPSRIRQATPRVFQMRALIIFGLSVCRGSANARDKPKMQADQGTLRARAASVACTESSMVRKPC